VVRRGNARTTMEDARTPITSRKIMRATGTVKAFNDAKGFGFIGRPGGEPDCFVHRSSIDDTGAKNLTEGETVEFDVILGRAGPSAAHVTRLPPGPARSPRNMPAGRP
jgi:CspA family cold shock protein